MKRLLEGIITEGDIEMFTEGDCHLLAFEIHAITGWPLCAFDHDGEPDCHTFVRAPSGHYLDINGLQTEREMHKEWGYDPGSIKVFKRHHFYKWGNEPAYDEGRARTIELAPMMIKATRGTA
jgi:hypothetical protein